MKRLRRLGLYAITWAKRLIPAAILVIAAILISTAIDRHNVQVEPGTDFINYTSFTVQNAREGEDVYFSVCRDHDQNYTFHGDVDVYVIQTDDGKPVKVYARDIQGQISNQCDNKVIKAKDYHHTPNLYEMTFCINFNVKYGIEKTVCKTSNRYRIYAQPTDIASQVASLKLQLAEAEARYQDAMADSDSSTQPSNLSTSNTSPAPVTTTPSQPATTTPKTQEVCDINQLLFIPIKLNCRQEPIN